MGGGQRDIYRVMQETAIIEMHKYDKFKDEPLI